MQSSREIFKAFFFFNLDTIWKVGRRQFLKSVDLPLLHAT